MNFTNIFLYQQILSIVISDSEFHLQFENVLTWWVKTRLTFALHRYHSSLPFNIRLPLNLGAPPTILEEIFADRKWYLRTNAIKILSRHASGALYSQTCPPHWCEHRGQIGNKGDRRRKDAYCFTELQCFVATLQ